MQAKLSVVALSVAAAFALAACGEKEVQAPAAAPAAVSGGGKPVLTVIAGGAA